MSSSSLRDGPTPVARNSSFAAKSFSLMRPWDFNWPPFRLQCGHAIEPLSKLAF